MRVVSSRGLERSGATLAFYRCRASPGKPSRVYPARQISANIAVAGNHAGADWNERVLLHGLAGQLLSGEARRGEDARLLRRAAPDGGNQQQLLPDAFPGGARQVGGRYATELSLRPEEPAADHP